MGDKSKWVVDTKDVDMELIYAALIAFPNNEDAIDFMAEHDYRLSEAKMQVYRNLSKNPMSPHFEKFQERREQLAPRLEAKLAEDMLTNAQRATDAEAYCIERIEEKLRMNEIKDPARVARDLSQIRTQAIDKRLALQGRPTQITAKLDVEEVVQSLEKLGAAKRVDAIEATVDDG